MSRLREHDFPERARPPLVVVRLALHSKINAELGFIVPMACIAPVSYTHLDVYKRQDYGIATIAAKVGYHNSGHFAKLFKNAYGMGPREYRMVQGIK